MVLTFYQKYSRGTNENGSSLEEPVTINLLPLALTSIIHPVYYGASKSILCYVWLKKQGVRGGREGAECR